MADRYTAPYLYNPDNGRVMINTALKRRVRPNLIPCRKLDASDVKDDPRVQFARRNDVPHDAPQIEDTPEANTNDTVAGGFEDIIIQVQDSEDKAELRQIGADVGLSLTKTMKLKTMKDSILETLNELQEQAR